jgi:hypothetical protein
VKFWGQKGSVTLRKFALKLEKKHQTFETAKLKKKFLVVTTHIPTKAHLKTGACAKLETSFAKVGSVVANRVRVICNSWASHVFFLAMIEAKEKTCETHA